MGKHSWEHASYSGLHEGTSNRTATGGTSENISRRVAARKFRAAETAGAQKILLPMLLRIDRHQGQSPVPLKSDTFKVQHHTRIRALEKVVSQVSSKALVQTRSSAKVSISASEFPHQNHSLLFHPVWGHVGLSNRHISTSDSEDSTEVPETWVRDKHCSHAGNTVIMCSNEEKLVITYNNLYSCICITVFDNRISVIQLLKQDDTRELTNKTQAQRQHWCISWLMLGSSQESLV